MKDVKDMVRVVGVILLGAFVLAIIIPLVLAAVGIIIHGVAFIVVSLIKLAVVLAVGYLILVGVRAILR